MYSLEKLISVVDNLTKSHISIVQKHAKQFNAELAYGAANSFKTSELTFNFVRSLVLDNIVENPLLLNAFLTNQVQNLNQLEAFSKISYTNKFQQILERLQAIVKSKKDEKKAAEAQAQLEKQMDRREQTQDQSHPEANQPEFEAQPELPAKIDNVPNVELSKDGREIKHAIGSILYQHLLLFEKARIFDIKKASGLQKQVLNLLLGYIKKLNQSQELELVGKAEIIQQNQDLIIANVLRVLAFF